MVFYGYPSDYCSAYGYSPYPYSQCIDHPGYGSPYGGYPYGGDPYYDSGSAPAPVGTPAPDMTPPPAPPSNAAPARRRATVRRRATLRLRPRRPT